MKLIAEVIITLATKLVKMHTPYRLSQRGKVTKQVQPTSQRVSKSILGAR